MNMQALMIELKLFIRKWWTSNSKKNWFTKGKGEYIGFVDGDDYIDKTCLSPYWVIY